MQSKVAEMMVNTGLTYQEMAEVLGVSEGRVKNLASMVFTELGVGGRPELTLHLRGKRLV